jgi:hypothetical protein
MSFGKAPSAPTPPDPVANSRVQGEMNERTARTNAALNRVNQVTPYGSLTYTNTGRGTEWLNQRMEQDRQAHADQGLTWDEANARSHFGSQNPYQDEYTATTTLSPSEQRQFDLSNEATETYGRAALSQLQRAEAGLSQPFEFTGGQAMTRPDFTGIGDPNQSRDAVEQALFARMNPGLQQGRASAETRLRNQGLTPGSEAWNAAIRDVNQQENDARLAVIAQAGQEQSRMFGLGMGQANLNNAAVQQRLQQDLALRAQPVNEAAALLSGQQINMPQFQQVPQVQVAPVDYLGAVGQQQAGQNAQFQARNANYMANLQGMYALGGAALGAGARVMAPRP